MVRDNHRHLSHKDRRIAAYEAALAIAQQITPESVLQCIVDTAREVVSARYAAFGLVDEQSRIVRVITSGMTLEEWARIGPTPDAQVLVGETIHLGNSPPVSNIATDSNSAELLSPDQQPMQILVSIPVLLGGRILGNLYLAERWDKQPFDEEDLAALQILSTHAAATLERANVYKRVEEQRDQLRGILDSMPVGVLVLAAPDGRIELANETMCQMLFGPGAPAGILPHYGRDLRTLRADGVPITHEERLGIRALRGEVSRDQQMLLECADGRQVPVLAQAAPLPSATGVIERAVLVFQDHTRLSEAEQLKDDFLSLVSHEFRTPLTTIHGGAHLLANQDENLDEKTRTELLDDIVIQSGRLDQMLANLLTLTAVTAGRLPVRTEPLLLEPLVWAIVAEVAARAPNHDFQVEIPSALPPSEGDPALLEQVLRNLYENAVKYSPAGGAIRTTASTESDTVTIHVADRGIGIATDEVGHVFKRFHRAGADPSLRGMGLGLYISRHLVEAQGGRITASSPGPGQGAIFSITLPLARDWQDGSDTGASNTNVGG